LLWPRIEHQDRATGGVIGKNPKHSPLVLMMEVKEAVPGEDAIEAPA
jgi:hypothetical protein